MPSLIELQYNPYLPRLNILLNGKQPPDFSQLVQYTDEDIWYWCNCILDSIYSEVRDDFYIEFTGTENDTGIMRYVCSRNSHCLAFREHSFVMNDSLQKRLGSLNQFIKKNDILDYQKTIIAAYFIIPQNMQHLLEEIVSIDIGNLFCSVRIETSKGNSLSFDDGESTYLFVLTDSFTDGLKSINRIKHQNPAIIINFGQDKGFCGIQENAFCYETTEENFISTVFQCFLTLPLLLAFRKCIQSLPEVKKKLDDFLKLSLVDPQIIVSVKSRIEIDKSTAIDVTLNPPMGKIPKLDYRILNSAVAECDGCSVFGKQRGKTALEVYRYGEKKPFYIQDIEVFVRNRLRRLFFQRMS